MKPSYPARLAAALLSVTLGMGVAVAGEATSPAAVPASLQSQPARDDATFHDISRAEKSLADATQAFEEGTKAAVREHLADAEKHLQKASRTSDEVTRNTTEALLTELETLKGQIEQDGASAKLALQRLWQQASALTERAADQVEGDWYQLRHPPRGRNALMEARLYVHFAQIDQFTGGDARQAGSELELALGYLDDAGRHVDPSRQAQVSAIRDEVQALIAQVGDSGPKARGVKRDYLQVIDRLSDLIRTL